MGVSFLNMIWDLENMQIEFPRSLFFLSNYRYVCVHVLICIVIFVFVLISFIKIIYSKLVS